MTTAPPWVATWEHHLRRLRALEVVAHEVHPDQAAHLLRRFAAEFVDPERRDALLEEDPNRAVPFERYLHADCTRSARVDGSLAWLRGGHLDLRCVRLERRPGLPALELDTSTMEDGWAASWPGVFVNFDRARALVISVDYEAFRCDLRSRRRTPYR